MERKIIKRKWTEKKCKNCTGFNKVFSKDGLSFSYHCSYLDPRIVKTPDDPSCEKFDIRVCHKCIRFSSGICMNGTPGDWLAGVGREKPGCEEFIYDIWA